MKIKTLSIMPITLFLFTSLFSFASAEDYPKEGFLRVNEESKVQTEDNATSAQKIKLSNGFSSSTSESERNENATKTNSNYKNDNDEMNSLVYRSLSLSLFQSLINIADREGGIGDELRSIANSQNNSASTTLSAMEKVEKRGSIVKFLIGANYKNLDIIRNELSKTNNNIDQLMSLLNRTTNESMHNDLDMQIKALEFQRVAINEYILTQEKIYSLFGWMTK